MPQVELEHLPGAPLKRVVAQVRFAPVYAIEQRVKLAGFQAALGDRYVAKRPAPRPPIIAGRTMTPQLPSPDSETIWRFEAAEEGDCAVSLASTSLALEAARYRDFDDFAAELSRVVRALHEAFEPQVEVRLGLRYVNRIEDKRLQKQGIAFFLEEQLATPVGGDLGNDLAGSLAELRFRERGGILAIRHGLIEPGHYLLDFDRFSAEERDFAPKSIVQRIKRFHDLIERLFVWSLSQRYLKELRKETR